MWRENITKLPWLRSLWVSMILRNRHFLANAVKQREEKKWTGSQISRLVPIYLSSQPLLWHHPSNHSTFLTPTSTKHLLPPKISVSIVICSKQTRVQPPLPITGSPNLFLSVFSLDSGRHQDQNQHVYLDWNTKFYVRQGCLEVQLVLSHESSEIRYSQLFIPLPFFCPVSWSFVFWSSGSWCSMSWLSVSMSTDVSWSSDSRGCDSCSSNTCSLHSGGCESCGFSSSFWDVGV